MPEYTLQSDHASVIAIDQHARSMTLCALDLAAGETRTGRLTDCPSALQVLDWASWAAEPRRFVYESGPCGFQLARDLLALGQRCDVIAVTSIPRSTSDKQRKDDRRDAESLLSAVTAQNSKCRAVYIPSGEAEAARDLVRTYYDLVLAMKRLKMQFSAMLLRHGHVWNERTAAGNLKGTWTRDYIAWASSIELGQPAADRALKVYLEDVLTGVKRCQQVKAECLELSETPRFKPYVDALSRLKGVDRITALTYTATMDDFSRFANGRSVSSYFGLTPGRHDSGEKTGRNGRITKAGDTTVRKAVVEGLASLPNFNGQPKWLPKGCAVSNAVEAEAVRCNQRNVKRYRELVRAGKRANVAKVAVAKELVREMWVLGRMVQGELEAKG